MAQVAGVWPSMLQHALVSRRTNVMSTDDLIQALDNSWHVAVQARHAARIVPRVLCQSCRRLKRLMALQARFNILVFTGEAAVVTGTMGVMAVGAFDRLLARSRLHV